MIINHRLWYRNRCGGEFEAQIDNSYETAFKFGSGIGLNIIKSIAVDASYKRKFQANYSGITVTYQAY